MSTFVLAFVITALAIAGMAIGVLLGRAPIRGSCGGASGGCALCSGKRRCRERERAAG